MQKKQSLVHQIARRVREGSLSVRKIAEMHLEQSKKLAHLGVFLQEPEEMIEQQIVDLEIKLKSGQKDLPLAGVPVAIKDNLQVKGTRTTCGSKMLANYVSLYDATVCSRLREAGALLFGKANMDEFAMGSSNENSAFFPCLNPIDESRVPGGSSGGSAAAVAAGIVPLALGSDTGGSVRQPASFCGVVGLKPTYGAISRYGLVAFGSSLDQVGPFGQTVQEVATLFKVIAGLDPLDSTSRSYAPSSDIDDLKDSESSQPLAGKRLGVIKELFHGEGIQPEVKEKVAQAIETYKLLGAQVDEVSLPAVDVSVACYYLIAASEASSNLSRFDGVRYGHRAKAENLDALYSRTRSEGFGAEVKRRILLGTFALSSGYYDAYYRKANLVRCLIADQVTKTLINYDALLSPTSPNTAFKIGENVRDPITMYLSDICTIFSNLSGNPAISIPCGFDSQKLPVGLQLIGKMMGEAELFRLAHAFERATDHGVCHEVRYDS